MIDKLKVKYFNKKHNAIREGIEFLLTFEEFCKLADDAGISYKDMNINGYHLARLGDLGPYKIGNCRFITAKENYKERKYKRGNDGQCLVKYKADNPDEWRKSYEEGMRNRICNPHNKLSDKEIIDRFTKISHLDFNVRGSIGKGCNILGMSHTSVRRIITRFKEINNNIGD